MTAKTQGSRYVSRPVPRPAGPLPRHLPVIDDVLAPDLCAGDLAVIDPASRYRGAGLYVVRQDAGDVIVKAERSGDGRLWLHQGSRHKAVNVSLATFATLVTGKVTARVRPMTPADTRTVHRLFLS